MSYAPHPWDALPAAPPAPGRDYEDALDPLPVAAALRVVELIRDADDLDDRALELESEADDHRSDARKLPEDHREYLGVTYRKDDPLTPLFHLRTYADQVIGSSLARLSSSDVSEIGKIGVCLVKAARAELDSRGSRAEATA